MSNSKTRSGFAWWTPMLLALAACQAAPESGLRFTLTPGGAPAPVAVAARAETARAVAPVAAAPAAAAAPVAAPVVPAPVAAAPVSAGGGGSGGGNGFVAPAAPDGKLTVDLHGFLAALFPSSHFHVLEAVSDIAKVEISVLQAGQTSASLTLTQADIANDAVTHTFTSLPNGNAILLVVAYDAQGIPIGSASQVVAITATGTTVAAMDVKLVNSGASPGPGSSLAADLTFTASTGTVVATFSGGYRDLYAAADGYLYGFDIVPTGEPVAYLVRLSPTTGLMLQHYIVDFSTPGGGLLHMPYPLVYNPVTQSLDVGARGTPAKAGDISVTAVTAAGHPFLLLDAGGNVYYSVGGHLMKVDPQGTSTQTTIPVDSAAALDTAGHFWTNAKAVQAVTVYDAAGTLLQTVTLDFVPTRIESDSNGGVWCMGAANKAIVHVAADGTVGAPVSSGVVDMCLDDHQNLWLAETTSLVRCLPDGSQPTSFPQAATGVTFGGGYVYANVSVGKILKITP